MPRLSRPVLPTSRRLVNDALLWRSGGAGARIRCSQYTSEQFQRLMAGRWRRLFDEPSRKHVGQRRHGKLLLVAENRTG